MSVTACRPQHQRVERRSASIRLGLLGCGRVGQAVARLAADDRSPLRAAGLDVACVRALVRDATRRRPGPPVPLTESAADVLQSGADVIVEALGGLEPARSIVSAALTAGIPVVSANKSLVARHGIELCKLAEVHGTAFAFEAAVVAGVPFVGGLRRRPWLAAPRQIAGIINGTSHYVLSAVAQGATLEEAVAAAVARGYAEPDSTADLSGRDAAEKLTILLHLCGRPDVRLSDLVVAGLDQISPADIEAARLLTGVIKPIALASLDPVRPGSWVGPAFVASTHPFAGLSGVTNAVRLTPASGEPVTFVGPGAGPDVTAATILDDVVEILCGAGLARPKPLAKRAPGAVGLAPPKGCWFVRIRRDVPVAARDAASRLADAGVSVDRVIAHAGGVYVRTRETEAAEVTRALAPFAAGGASVLALPALQE